MWDGSAVVSSGENHHQNVTKPLYGRYEGSLKRFPRPWNIYLGNNRPSKSKKCPFQQVRVSNALVLGLADRLGVAQEGPFGLPAGLTPEDIFHYVYAVLHSPEYRRRYAGSLTVDFPRVP